MILRPNTRNSIVKLDSCGHFCTQFVMLPAVGGQQIVKLEVGGHKVTIMAVPAVLGA